MRQNISKQGKTKPDLAMWVIAVAVVVLAVGLIGQPLGLFSALGLGQTQETALQFDEDGEPIVLTGIDNCNQDKESDLTITLTNGLNTTGAEQYDATIRFTKDGVLVETLTDTTDGSLTNIACGADEVLTGYIIATDSNGGDGSKIQSASGDCSVDENGNLQVVVNKPQLRCQINGHQHSTLQFRAKDMQQGGDLMFDNADSSATDYETTGVTFTSVTNNATAMTVDTSTPIDVIIEVKAVNTAGDFNDMGMLVTLDNIDTNVYNEPTVTVNGDVLPEVKGELDVYQARALSGDDYVYSFDISILDDSDVDVGIKASVIDGQSVSTNPQVTFYSIGNYLKTIGNEIGTSSHKDDASNTAVYTAQVVNFDAT